MKGILHTGKLPTTPTSSSSPSHGGCLPSPLSTSVDRSFQLPHPVLSNIPVSTSGSTIAHRPTSFMPTMGISASAASFLRLPQLVLPLFHPCLRDVESVAKDQKLVINDNGAAIIYSRENSYRSFWESGSPADRRNLFNPLVVIVVPLPLPPSISLPFSSLPAPTQSDILVIAGGVASAPSSISFSSALPFVPILQLRLRPRKLQWSSHRLRAKIKHMTHWEAHIQREASQLVSTTSAKTFSGAGLAI